MKLHNCFSTLFSNAIEHSLFNITHWTYFQTAAICALTNVKKKYFTHSRLSERRKWNTLFSLTHWSFHLTAVKCPRSNVIPFFWQKCPHRCIFIMNWAIIFNYLGSTNPNPATCVRMCPSQWSSHGRSCAVAGGHEADPRGGVFLHLCPWRVHFPLARYQGLHVLLTGQGSSTSIAA